jgi:putative transposase
MPWKKSRASDEHLKFIAEVLSGDSTMTGHCRHFCVSRKTGYKWNKRYEVGGAAALVDLSRRPHSHSDAIPECTRERLLFAAIRCQLPLRPVAEKIVCRVPVFNNI